jgi:N-formylglutamate amidohydrolase
MRKSSTFERSAVKVARSVRRGPGEKGVVKPPRRLATRLSWQQTERRQAPERSHHPRESLSARDSGEISWAIAHTHDNYLSAFYHRVARRRGKHKAIMALAHKILVILYHVLKDKKPYTDLGADYFDQLDAARIQRHHIRRLEQLGYVVTLTPKGQEAG